MDVAGQTTLAIAIIMSLFAGAVLGHMFMPVYVYVTTTVTVTKEVTVTKTITFTKTVTLTLIGSPPPNASLFNLQECKIVVYANRISLLVMFTTYLDAKMIVIGPDNKTISTVYVKPSDREAYLALAPPGVLPKPGTYKLVVVDLLGNKLYERTLVLHGPSIKVLDVKMEKSWDDIVKGVIKELNITVANNGDMPAFIHKLIVQVDKRNYTIPVQLIVIPIGKIELDFPTTIADIDKGDHNLTIILMGREGTILAIYNTTISFP